MATTKNHKYLFVNLDAPSTYEWIDHEQIHLTEILSVGRGDEHSLRHFFHQKLVPTIPPPSTSATLTAMKSLDLLKFEHVIINLEAAKMILKLLHEQQFTLNRLEFEHARISSDAMEWLSCGNTDNQDLIIATKPTKHSPTTSSRNITSTILQVCTIKFTNCELGNDCVAALGKALELCSPTQFCHVQTLRLFGCHVEDSGILALAKGIKNNKTLTDLQLDHNKFTDACINVLFQAILQSQTILHVSMNCSDQLSHVGIQHLATTNLQSKHPLSTIQSLSFCHCELIADAGVQYLADSLRNDQCPLRSLNLFSCSITNVGIIVLAHALQTNTMLQKLNLDENSAVTNVGLYEMYKTMRDYNMTLHNIVLDEDTYQQALDNSDTGSEEGEENHEEYETSQEENHNIISDKINDISNNNNNDRNYCGENELKNDNARSKSLPCVYTLMTGIVFFADLNAWKRKELCGLGTKDNLPIGLLPLILESKHYDPSVLYWILHQTSPTIFAVHTKTTGSSAVCDIDEKKKSKTEYIKKSKRQKIGS